MNPPILVCTIGNKGIEVLKSSCNVYNPDIKLHIVQEEPSTFGETYNKAMSELFEEYDEIIIANDDIVLTPTSVSLLMEDVNLLKSEGVKIGFVAARSDFVRTVQARTVLQLYSSELIQAFAVSPLFAYINKEAFKAAQFPPINYWSDDIMCMDLFQLGFHHYISRSYIHHVGSQTIGTTYSKFLTEDKPWVLENRPQYRKLLFGE